MKKTFVVLLLLIMTITSFNVNAANKPTGLKSKNILLADASSGKYLYSKGIESKIQPGGFAKIMTARNTAIVLAYPN